MSAFTPEVRERLGAAINAHPSMEDDVLAALTHIDALEASLQTATRALHKATEANVALEARVAVLAAECRASRAHDACSDTGRNRAVTWSELCEARRQTDAAGALEGGKP